ncbi:MAG: alpha/beta hydrolase [Planctomycetes bacterium]|nr:alpha/beta hydrolase [Planctomycetota bacterium]
MASLLLYVIGILVLVYAVWGLALLFLQPRLLYRPLREVSFTPADLGLEYEEVAFHSADGVRLTGWYIPAKDRGQMTEDGGQRTMLSSVIRRPFSERTVLVCHGNGGNIGHLLESFKILSRLGVSCFAFDYRGYGNSDGRPTEAGMYLDAQAAYHWVTSVRGIPPEQIVLLGRSLGASVAAHLAGRVRVAGLALESGFPSYLDIAARFYPYLPVKLFRRFLFRYDTLACIKDVRCPVMVLHSRNDELVPFVFATRLFEAAHEPKQFVELIGSHNEGFLLSGDIYIGAWRKWLDLVKDGQSESVVRQVS